MLSPAQAVLLSWSLPPWVTALNLLAALLYLRGWLALRHLLPRHLPTWRLASFLAGLATLQIALASPIDGFDGFSLADHMVQHMVLMVVVPPLLLLANPALPLLRGLPRAFTRRGLAPLLRWRPLRRLGRALTHPAFCWFTFAIVLLVWHAPAPYDLALRSDAWHDLEHASFLFASILFWWPVIDPWPSRPHWPRWFVPVYLLFAEFVGTLISAFLVFSRHVIYSPYLTMPRLDGLSALNDQVLAGVVMWSIGSLAFMIPAIATLVTLLEPAAHAPPRRRPSPRQRSVPPAGRRRAFPARVVSALVLLLPLAVLVAAYAAPEAIDVDGAVVRLQAAAGPLDVSVFTPPDPLPAGACPVAVLVQDRASGAAVLDLPVTLEVAPLAGAPADAATPATHAASSLKLLQAATVNLPGPGAWRLQVAVGQGAHAARLQTVVHVQNAQ